VASELLTRLVWCPVPGSEHPAEQDLGSPIRPKFRLPEGLSPAEDILGY